MKICDGKECKYYNDTNYVSVSENIIKPYCRLTNEFLVVDWNKQIVLSKNDKCISDDNTNTLKNNDRETYYYILLKDKYKSTFADKTHFINKELIGKIVNQTSSNFYFEIKDSNDLFIIPHNSIEWLIPLEKNVRSSSLKMDEIKRKE